MLTAAGGIVALVAALVGLSQIVLRWRAHGIADVREVAVFMRTMFGDVIAHGELDAPKFMTEEARANETRLGDLQHQVRSRKLRAELERLMDCWKRTFANALPPFVGFAWVGGDRPAERWTNRGPEERAQTERQVQAARDGLEAVKGVLARCTALERWVVKP